jgi:hypothetical protein
MFARTFVRSISLVLAVVLLIAAPMGFAAKKPAPRKATTDAAGRTHVRPARGISDAQRKAAAHLRKSIRTRSLRPVHKSGGQK